MLKTVWNQMLNHECTKRTISRCQAHKLRHEKRKRSARTGQPITLTINGWESIIYLVQCPNVDGSWCCLFVFLLLPAFYLCNCNFRIHCFRGHFFCSDSCVCVCVRADRLLLVFTSPAKYFVCTIVLFDVFWRHFLAEPQNSRHCSPPKNVTFWAQIKSNGANNKNGGCRASKETHKRTYTHMHEMNFVWIWMQIALWMHNLQQPSRNEGGTHLSLYGLCFYLPFVWHFAQNAHQQFHRGSVLWCSLFAVG